jgi:hypothetical protein
VQEKSPDLVSFAPRGIGHQNSTKIERKEKHLLQSFKDVRIALKSVTQTKIALHQEIVIDAEADIISTM